MVPIILNKRLRDPWSKQRTLQYWLGEQVIMIGVTNHIMFKVFLIYHLTVTISHRFKVCNSVLGR